MGIEQSRTGHFAPTFELHQKSAEQSEAAIEALQKEIARTEHEIEALEKEEKTLQLEQAIRGLREQAEAMRAMIETSGRNKIAAEEEQVRQLRRLPVTGTLH